MALTDDQRAYLRRRLGSTLDETDLEARFARLLSYEAVAVEVLEERLATLASRPLSFSISGEYQEDRQRNVNVVESMLSAARADMAEAAQGVAGVIYADVNMMR